MYNDFIKPAFLDVKTFVLDTLFPVSCLACSKEGEFICVDCKILLKTLGHQRCIACQKPTPFGLTHSGCQTPHGADALISFYDYHDKKMADIIIAGKYNFIPATYEVLGAMMAQKLKAQFPNILISNNIYNITPIPLHPTRKRWRGFNQAEILCEKLSAELGLPCSSVLVRGKQTKTQKDLKKEDRQKNMRDAFTLAKNAEVHNKNFILVDDVTTTGSTLQQAAQTLKRNGAAKVICLTVARD